MNDLEKIKKAVELAKELDLATYKLYLGYPPNDSRWSHVTTSSIRSIKGINTRFQSLFKREIHPELYRYAIAESISNTDREAPT